MICLPEGFANRMKEQLGTDCDEFLGCYTRPAVKALRFNRRKVSPVDHAQLCMILTGSDTPDPVKWWDGAFYYDNDGPGSSPLHEAGVFYIQEPSAMLPVTLLDVYAGDLKILDLCAAPGGKSTQIADLTEGCGLIVSNEIIPKRAQILSENIERMGITNALVISADPDMLAERFAGYFDRILVDAPCSGEGMFRKTPEAVKEWSKDNVDMCAKRQEMLLDHAVSMLSEGGRIVYSTCTFSPEEDEGVTEHFLATHPEFEICDGPVKVYPHTVRGEGHYAVAFARKGSCKGTRDTAMYGSCPTGRQSLKQSSTLQESLRVCGTRFVASLRTPEHPRIPLDAGAGGKVFPRKPCGGVGTWSAYFADLCTATPEEERERVFEGMALPPAGPQKLIHFGDSVYLAPEIMPDIDGLKVYRAGLKIGTHKKNRFEPDHALSHALTADEADHIVNYGSDAPEVRQYLSGMTLSCDKDLKGWCLVCVMGYPLGWAKAAGGILKNHYPRGLRRNL